jgi:MoxR-like ATPase
MGTKETADALLSGLSSVIRGKNAKLEIFIASFLAGGHVLIEDVPGLGKTTLAKSLARLVGKGVLQGNNETASFKRIQFTPDLLPYDITGVDIFNPQTKRFEFIPGPVFCDILLADEINRTTPKVQSALLEVMAEKQVTSGGITRSVSDIFFVVATQNPVDTEGTYSLPAAQLDRFMIHLTLDYPDEISELEILHNNPSFFVLPQLLPVISEIDIHDSICEQSNVFCHPALEHFIISLVRATRNNSSILLGASPRAALHYLQCARALALSRGRSWIEDQDLIDLSIPVLSHRIIAKDFRIDISVLINNLVDDLLRVMDKKTDWSKGMDNT